MAKSRLDIAGAQRRAGITLAGVSIMIGFMFLRFAGLDRRRLFEAH
jgi:hypothetical protein